MLSTPMRMRGPGPQVRDQIAYLGVGEQIQVGAHARRHSRGPQAECDRAGLRVGPKQDSDFAGIVNLAGSQEPSDLGCDEARFVQLVAGGVDSCPRTRGIAGPRFTPGLEWSGEDIAQGDHHAGGPMVLIERKYLGVGVLAREVEQELRIRTTPPIDGLVWVAHHRQVPMARDDLAEQAELRIARILELVDHDKAVGILDEAQRP